MLDEVGGRGVLKAFAFFKNLKNFKNLSTFRKIRLVSMPLIPLMLLVGAPLALKAQSSSVIETLRVTPVQKTMMDTCINAHTTKNIQFGDIVSTPKGCACVSKLVSSVTPPAHYDSFAAVQELAISQYYWSYESDQQDAIDAEFDTRISEEIMTLANTQGLNQKGLRHMFDYVLSADQICDTRESYQGESLTSLAALMPLETPIWEGDQDGVIEISLRGAEQPIRVSMAE